MYTRVIVPSIVLKEKKKIIEQILIRIDNEV